MPAGLPRLAWRAGGLRLIAREATLARRLAGGYLLFLLAFPLIGLGAGAWSGMSTAEVPGGPGPGGGPPGHGPSPGTPDGGRYAGAGDDDVQVLRVLGPNEDRTRDLVGAPR